MSKVADTAAFGCCLVGDMKVFRARELCNTPERAGLLGVSESGLYWLISQGRFPKPNVRFNKRAVGWTEDIVSAAVEALRVDR